MCRVWVWPFLLSFGFAGLSLGRWLTSWFSVGKLACPVRCSCKLYLYFFASSASRESWKVHGIFCSTVFFWHTETEFVRGIVLCVRKSFICTRISFSACVFMARVQCKFGELWIFVYFSTFFFLIPFHRIDLWRTRDHIGPWTIWGAGAMTMRTRRARWTMGMTRREFGRRISSRVFKRLFTCILRADGGRLSCRRRGRCMVSRRTVLLNGLIDWLIGRLTEIRLIDWLIDCLIDWSLCFYSRCTLHFFLAFVYRSKRTNCTVHQNSDRKNSHTETGL